jgi:hypothetical protein
MDKVSGWLGSTIGQIRGNHTIKKAEIMTMAVSSKDLNRILTGLLKNNNKPPINKEYMVR